MPTDIACYGRITVLVGVAFLAETSRADDWPQWLGPRRDAVWRESGIVDTFPEQGPPLRWKTSIGSGYSGPAVSNGRVFVMDRVATDGDPRSGKLLHEGPAPKNVNFVRRSLTGRERVVCLKESDGTILWTRDYDCPYTTVAIYAIGPRVTPTVEADLVYALGAEGDLLCLDCESGAVVWSRDFKKDYGLSIPAWGVAAHPLVDGDKLICMVGGKGATVVAFDRTTGKELWRALDAEQPGYCPPMIHQINGRRRLLVWHGSAVCALDPETGRQYWSVPFEATFAMAIGAPRIEGDSLFVMSFNRRSALIRLAKDGNSASIVWQGGAQRGIGGVLNTAHLEEGHIYACGPNGRYLCARLDTGERKWSTFEPSTGRRPAPWANVFTIKNGDRYFLANDLGDLIIARMNPEGYREISRAHLIEPTHAVAGRTVVWSHPAFANRSVYLRNDKEIRCYLLAKE